jgi:hypothetical protein
MNFIRGVLAMWVFIAVILASCFVCYEVWILLVKFFGKDVGNTIALFLFFNM